MISNDKRGLVLIIVLCLVLLFVLVFAYFMLMSTREITAVKSQDESIRAFYLAEAGLERVRYDLGQDNDWSNGIDVDGTTYGPSAIFYTLYGSTPLSYSVKLKNIAEDGGYKDDEIWVKSTGSCNNAARAIQAKLTSARQYDDLANNVTSAIEAKGSITLQGSAEIIGDYEEYADVSFEDIFGMTKDEMREIAQDNWPATYYNVTSSQKAFKDDTATQVTWINSPDYQSQVTSANWAGDGILIVEGDLKLTGGTFDGIVYVIGELSIGAGGATLNGGVFVESGVTVDTTLSGNALINFDADDIGNAFTVLSGTLPVEVEYWEEVSP